MLRAQVEDEFRLLIRRAVADRKLTPQEHRKLDLARDLIGISEAEAEAARQVDRRRGRGVLRRRHRGEARVAA